MFRQLNFENCTALIRLLSFCLVLDMSGNPINVLGPNFFGGFPAIRYLYLENIVNKTNLAVHEKAFETNIYIQKLDLSNNNMLQIPREIFENNRAIQILNMKGNSLSSFPSLESMRELQQIDFSDNLLDGLKASTFKRNSQIKVRNNHLRVKKQNTLIIHNFTASHY